MATVASLAVEILARTENFMKGTADVVERVYEVADAADEAARKVAGLVGRAADMATMLPVSNAVATVFHGVAAAMKAVAMAGLAILAAGAVRSLFFQISLQAGIAQAAVASLTRTLVFLGVKLAVVSGLAGAALFLGMAASAEAADRNILGLIGATTPLQDALARIGEAWRLWSDFVASDFFNMVGTGLGTMASTLVEIISTIRFINDATGGWLKTTVMLIGISMTLYGAWKLIAYISGIVRTAWAVMANTALFKPVIATFALLWNQLLVVSAAQNSLNISTFAYLKTKIGLAAIAVAHGIGAAATWAWAAAQTALNIAATYFFALSLVGLAAVLAATAAAKAYTASLTSQTEAAATASAEFASANRELATTLDEVGRKSAAALQRLKELSDFSKDMNLKGQGIEARDVLQQQKIADAVNVKEVGAAVIAAIVDKEIVPLMATIEKNKQAIERLSGTTNGQKQAEAIKAVLVANEDKLKEVNKKLDETKEIVKNTTPLDEVAQALAHRQRIESNLKELNINVIKSAQEIYAERLKNLDTALANQWISLGQYNLQLEAAAKAFREGDAATRARIEAEKKLSDSLDQAAKSIADSLKTPWMKYAEQAQLVDDLSKSGKLDEYAAADALTKNNVDLKAAMGFADIRTPSEQLADRLYDLVRITKEVGTSETQMKRQMDTLAADLASAAGIGDLFSDLHENKVAKLSEALDGIDGLLALGKLTEEAAAKMREDAARKFVPDKTEAKAPTMVVAGTTEAYQRDQEVLRGATTAEKQLEEIKKLLAEAEASRTEQEESRRTLERIDESVYGLRNMKAAGV